MMALEQPNLRDSSVKQETYTSGKRMQCAQIETVRNIIMPQCSMTLYNKPIQA